MSTKTAVVIPARFGSTRFPGKPLAKIAGKEMILHTVERAAASKADLILVATDDERIAQLCSEKGIAVAMTASDHPTGTDRIAEAVRGKDIDLIINLQGDEPLLPTEMVDKLIDSMIEDSEAQMATVAVRNTMERKELLAEPNIVKVACDLQGNALYFSRSGLPYFRNCDEDDFFLTHWGIYAYRRQLLEQFVTWEQTPLEKAESLEQLRALENGIRIKVLQTTHRCVGVDTPEDIAKVEQLLKQENTQP